MRGLFCVPCRQNKKPLAERQNNDTVLAVCMVKGERVKLFKKHTSGHQSLVTLFPPAWCPQTYRKLHPDLAQMDDSTLAQHYEQFGKGEGRQAGEVRNRFDFIKLLDNIRPALEIGAFDSPLLHPRDVKHFDVLDQAALIQRATELQRAAHKVPRIDFVSEEGDLSVIREQFRLVLSSHAIEHTPDLIKHLAEVERILSEDGVYALMVPDCRYCFDHFISPSTIAEILQAHVEKKKVHTLASIIEHRALTTHNDAGRHWRNDHGAPTGTDANRVLAAMREWQNSAGKYVDVHAWQFTPDSFAQNITLLGELGLTRLKPIRVYQTIYGSNEFLAVLSKQDGTTAP